MLANEALRKAQEIVKKFPNDKNIDEPTQQKFIEENMPKLKALLDEYRKQDLLASDPNARRAAEEAARLQLEETEARLKAETQGIQSKASMLLEDIVKTKEQLTTTINEAKALIPATPSSSTAPGTKPDYQQAAEDAKKEADNVIKALESIEGTLEAAVKTKENPSEEDISKLKTVLQTADANVLLQNPAITSANAQLSKAVRLKKQADDNAAIKTAEIEAKEKAKVEQTGILQESLNTINDLLSKIDRLKTAADALVNASLPTTAVSVKEAASKASEEVKEKADEAIEKLKGIQKKATGITLLITIDLVQATTDIAALKGEVETLKTTNEALITTLEKELENANPEEWAKLQKEFVINEVEKLLLDITSKTKALNDNIIEKATLLMSTASSSLAVSGAPATSEQEQLATKAQEKAVEALAALEKAKIEAEAAKNIALSSDFLKTTVVKIAADAIAKLEEAKISLEAHDKPAKEAADALEKANVAKVKADADAKAKLEEEKNKAAQEANTKVVIDDLNKAIKAAQAASENLSF